MTNPTWPDTYEKDGITFWRHSPGTIDCTFKAATGEMLVLRVKPDKSRPEPTVTNLTTPNIVQPPMWMKAGAVAGFLTLALELARIVV